MDTFATVTELVGRLRDKEVSARELVDAYLARIEACGSRTNAVVTLDADRARARAGEADAARSRGELWGPLHGVPFTLKDAHATAGVRTTVGHPRFADNVPGRDGTVAARLQAAGAILLGKTNVPPMLMSAQTDNPIFGPTKNPWNTGRTPGGSSGGSGAAVADGLTAFDVGSDMSGSIRIPANYCGVFGIKPTPHRVPETGHVPPPEGMAKPEYLLATIGPLARSAEDLSLLMKVLVGPDGSDVEVAPVPWREERRRDPASLKVAFLPVFPGVPTSRAVTGAVEGLAADLERAGARVEQRPPGFTVDALNDVWRDYFRIVAAALADIAGTSLPVKAPDGPAPTVGDLARVLHRRAALIAAMESALDDFDAFLCPAGISTAPPLAPPRTPIPVDGEEVDSRFVDHYLYPWNLLGNPAVVVPARIADDGLPVGVQLVGRRFGDEALLEVARAVGEVAGGFRPPPV